MTRLSRSRSPSDGPLLVADVDFRSAKASSLSLCKKDDRQSQPACFSRGLKSPQSILDAFSGNQFALNDPQTIAGDVTVVPGKLVVPGRTVLQPWRDGRRGRVGEVRAACAENGDLNMKMIGTLSRHN